MPSNSPLVLHRILAIILIIGIIVIGLLTQCNAPKLPTASAGESIASVQKADPNPVAAPHKAATHRIETERRERNGDLLALEGRTSAFERWTDANRDLWDALDSDIQHCVNNKHSGSSTFDPEAQINLCLNLAEQIRAEQDQAHEHAAATEELEAYIDETGIRGSVDLALAQCAANLMALDVELSPEQALLQCIE